MAQAPINLAKISLPTLVNVYPRQRLFKVLGESAQRPVTWISSPAGSGKTMLAASYVETKNCRCLWYQLDEGDADIATFFYYLGLAGKKAAPHKRKPLPLLTPEYLAGLNTFTRRYFEELYTRLKPGSVLVFDNYQEVPAESPLHAVFREALAAIPRGVNLIVLSRGDPPPELTAQRAGNVIGLIGWEEMQLTLPESRAILGLRKHPAGRIQSGADPETLHELAQGWAAGLVLLAEQDGIEESLQAPAGAFRPELVFDYFAHELFGRMEPEIRAFLLKTALLPEITAPMAQELSGHPRAERVLARLSRNNYFTIRHARSHQHYQYHPLFREFLLMKAQETFEPGELARLQRLAAKLLAQDNQTEAAVELLRASGDWEELTRLALEHAPALMVQGRFRTLLGWLEDLPLAERQRDPWLLYWLGTAWIPVDPLAARRCFEQVFHRFEAAQDWAGQYLTWAGIVETFILRWDDFKPLHRWVMRLDELFSRHPEFPSQEIEAGVVRAVIAALLWVDPFHPALPAWAERANRIVFSDANFEHRIKVGARLLPYYFWLGDHSGYRMVQEALRPEVNSRELPPLVRIDWLFMESLEALYIPSENPNLHLFETALQVLRKALEISQSTGVYVLDFTLLWASVYYAVLVGDRHRAEAHLARMASLMSGFRGVESAIFNSAAAQVAFLKGDLDGALQKGMQALLICEEKGTPYLATMTRIGLAFTLIELENTREAAQHLLHAARTARRMRSKNQTFSCLLLRTYLAAIRGKEALALKLLRSAMSLPMGQGRYHVLSWFRSRLWIRVCSLALEAGIEPAYFQQIIRNYNLAPESPAQVSEAWPWPVRVYTLGRFSVLLNEKTLTFQTRTHRKPLELLKVLVALGGENVPEILLSESVWPEAEGDLAHGAFATTLNRLRKLIGRETLQLRDGRLTLDPNGCWVDSRAFEAELTHASHALKNGDGRAAWHYTEKALALYRGPFLEGEFDPPEILSAREKLHGLFLRHIETLGQFYGQNQQIQKAIVLYRKGLEADNLAEEICQNLMRCYAQLGRIAEGVAVYERFRRILQANIGIDLSPETEAIYQSLIGAQGRRPSPPPGNINRKASPERLLGMGIRLAHSPNP